MTPKDKAIKQVRDNNPTDYQKLFAFAVLWVKTKMYPFTSEDLKTAYLAEHEPPRQPNIFGAAINAMACKKLIYEAGTATAKLKKAHGRLLRKWISHEYRLHQQVKAQGVKPMTLFEI